MHYLVDADVLLLRLDHPHALLAHLIHDAKYVHRVQVRYLKECVADELRIHRKSKEDSRESLVRPAKGPPAAGRQSRRKMAERGALHENTLAPAQPHYWHYRVRQWHHAVSWKVSRDVHWMFPLGS